MMIHSLRTVKNRLVPSGRHLRRLPVGLGSGLRLSVDFRHETGLYLGLYERELNKHISALCRPGTAAFDVGGYLGYDALILAKLSRGGRVASFEADPNRCDLIAEAAAANPRVGALVTVHNVFVSSGSDNARRISLDDFAFGPDGFLPDFMKIDIEGAELEALHGAQRLLSEKRPHLIIEVHSAQLEQECVESLRSFRYAPIVVDQRRWLRDNRPVGVVNRWLVARGQPAPVVTG